VLDPLHPLSTPLFQVSCHLWTPMTPVAVHLLANTPTYCSQRTPPPYGTTHCHGCWTLGPDGRHWEVHPNPIRKDQLPSNVSDDDDHRCNWWCPTGEFVDYQRIRVSWTHHTHSRYLKNHPPPTVSYDPNVTVASTLPMVPLDPNMTGTTSAHHPSITTPTSNVSHRRAFLIWSNHSCTSLSGQ
jgi:hypothetical protein